MPATGGVDGAGDQFLAGSGLPGDENRGVGLGDTIDLVERLQQGRALADDLVEVVNRFDLFLKVDIFGSEASLFLFHEDVVGDVHEHRACVFAAGFRLRPPLHPDGFAVVFAAKLQHGATGVRAAADRRERLLDARWASGVSGTSDIPTRPGTSSGLIPGCAGRHGWRDKPRLEVFFDVSDRGFFIQVPQTLLAARSSHSR